jgi:hypothetical protein
MKVIECAWDNGELVLVHLTCYDHSDPQTWQKEQWDHEAHGLETLKGLDIDEIWVEEQGVSRHQQAKTRRALHQSSLDSRVRSSATVSAVQIALDDFPEG